MVVADGLTLNEPLADVGMKPPGAMERLVAPTVTQLNVLLAPDVMFVGLAVKELIAGLPAPFTETVSIDVLDPAGLVAVSV